jgi:predicted acylesterase/phospholipase RssA
MASLEESAGTATQTPNSPASQPRLDQPAGGDGHGPGDGDWAVCCSGGGIRSAAYCLGALQSLDRGGLLAKVQWILGVSGGSYIASSRALVA